VKNKLKNQLKLSDSPL